MIKLKHSEALVSLDNVRLVKKVCTVDKGDNRSRRYIEISYTDGNCVQIGYGRDEHYYVSSNPNLDNDYKQIEEELLGEYSL